jgi:Zn-dependent metalloprotease
MTIIGKVATRQLWFDAMKRMPDQVGEVAIVPFANAVQRAAADRYGAQSREVQAVINAYTTIGVY